MGEHNCYKTDVVECIQKKAYELWEKDGRKQGRDLNYWLAAEKAVKGGNMKKMTSMSLLVAFLITSLLGCNTARGVGTDIKDTGTHIENIGK